MFPERVTQETLSSIQPKLKDFATGSNLSAVAALIVRLSSERRKAAREDLWAALDADIAAQDAAAESLRKSGLCQLFGAILASGGAIAGAGMNLKGARESQLRFDSNAPKASSGLDGRSSSGVDPLDTTRIAHAQTAAARETMRWSGMATIVAETSKIYGAGLNMASTNYQEEKAKHEADSTKAKAHVEDERQYMEYYQAQIQDMLGKLAEIRSADSETRGKLVNMV
ncbi:hypothetical protein [Bradyrhizobium sp. B120]|uniref:hypothetical protein n=1 Tax=Bradyrhizobium sp. B120 TaxID=3410088 RepID=UPI003B986DCD